MKNLVLSLFMLITPVLVFSQSRTELREKLQGVAIRNDSLEAVIFDLQKELSATAKDLDSLKGVYTEIVVDELPTEKPTTWWGWAVVIVGIAVKLISAGLLTSVLTLWAKTKDTVGAIFNKVKVEDGRGFWILALASVGVSLVVEIVNTPVISEYSFVDAGKYFTAIMTVAMALYHLGLKRLFERRA